MALNLGEEATLRHYQREPSSVSRWAGSDASREAPSRGCDDAGRRAAFAVVVDAEG
jgi:hypothetical protein